MSLLSDTDVKTLSLVLSFLLYCRYKRQRQDKDNVLTFCLFYDLLDIKDKDSAVFTEERRRHGKYNTATGGTKY